MNKNLEQKIRESEKQKEIIKKVEETIAKWKDYTLEEKHKVKDSLICDIALLPDSDLNDVINELTRARIFKKKELKEIIEAVRIEEPEEKEKKKKIKEITKTILPNVIHLIPGENENINYLMLTPGGDLKKIPFVLNENKKYTPKQDLPIKYPSENALIYYLQDNNVQLLKDVESYIKRYVELPSKSGYFILALWVAHTYLIEFCDCSPYLYFFGEKETGKSRAGEVLSKVAFKGQRLTSPTEASLFREAEYFKMSLIIDELRLWGQDARVEVADLIKSRYKRGLKVARIDTKKAGEDQVEFFDVFGPLVICTTETMPSIIEQRCLMWTMRKNIKASVEEKIDDELCQDLRDRLTGARARAFKDGIPEIKKSIGRRRLREIIEPLHQALLVFDPDREGELKRYAKEVEREKAEEEGLSLQAEIVRAITELKEEDIFSGGRFATKQVADILNKGKSEKEEIKIKSLGWMIKRLGFKSCRMPSGSAQGYALDGKLLKNLRERFKVD